MNEYKNIVKWNEMSIILDDMLNKIFNNTDFNSMTNFEKRKRIFDYMVNNVKYDYQLLEDIKFNEKLRKNNFSNQNDTKFKKRNLTNEVLNVVTKNKGICSSISQIYKMLLDRVNIESICFICNDSTEIPHQLVLVKEEDICSFDDITSVIVNRGSKEDFFDYDLEDAINYHQTDMFGLPSELVYAIVGRDYSNKREKLDNNGFVILPSNIKKYQSNNELGRSR